MSLVYHINKGINKPIVFKGFQGQYIAWLAGGLVLLMLCFTVLYVSGLSIFVLLPMVFFCGGGLFMGVSYLSRRFGQHGLGKFMAKRGLPVYLRFSSRRVFTALRVPVTNKERQGRA
ncbi:DUF4133 domain-containing protein [Pedobacter sp. GSP4]|uniref:DUF4133 domain-containing protein n=1 Tax=Pedobacter sp. GSP4 TaxID=3453716 RepID=UPI003EEBA6A8